jgi:hypothetical protein
MPRIGVSITKSTPFRNSVQEFSNVYYYEMLAMPDAAAANTIIDNIVVKEKTIHSTLVTFVRGRLWSQEGAPGLNEMITQKNLSGTGSAPTVSSFDKERAYLVRLRAGNDSRGNPVYLRKWFHSCGAFGTASAPGATILENTTGFSGAQLSGIESQVGWIGDANGSAGTPKICAKGGRLATVGANWQSHPFLEHHQLGDMWRAQ